MFFVVKQHNPFNKQWHTISYYNKSGNFLGPAIFEKEQEAQNYLEEYERKLLLHLASIHNNNTNYSDSNSTNNNQKHHNETNKKSDNYDDDNNNDNHNNRISKRRGKGRPSRSEHIKLKVFQESTLPPINKPSSFFHESN